MPTTDYASPISNVSSANASVKAAPKNALDKDSFLKLLVAQLQHQDPTQTQDSDKMVQQMTSFANLEQVQNQTKALETLQSQNLGIFQTQATSLVGKTVRISQGMNLQDGKADFVMNLPSATVSTSISVKDASGKVIRVMEKGSMAAGDHAITWDGRDSTGKKMEDGIYTLEVAGKDKAGAEVTGTTSCFATVESVSFTSGSVTIKAAGRNFSLSQVSEVSGATSTGTVSPTQYANMIGKHVRINGNVAVEGGQSNFTLKLPADSASTLVTIKDSAGKTIQTLDLKSRMAGENPITWDGMDSKGQKVPDGVYTVEVSAQSAAGKPIMGSASGMAKVQSILSSDGMVLLRIGNRTFGLNDISEISA